MVAMWDIRAFSELVVREFKPQRIFDELHGNLDLNASLDLPEKIRVSIFCLLELVSDPRDLSPNFLIQRR